MRQRLIQDARGHIGQARYAQHAQPAVHGHNGLRHSGHAHRVRAQHARHADFRRRFIAGAVEPGIYALAQSNVLALGHIQSQRAQLAVISAGHIREARAKGLQVFAAQGILT